MYELGQLNSQALLIGNSNENTTIQGQTITLNGDTILSGLTAGTTTLANTTVTGTLGVSGATTLSGLTAGNTTLANTTVTGTLGVSGATTLNELTAGETNLSGSVVITGNSNIKGNLLVTGTISNSSDRRLKENIQTLQNSLDKILALQGVSYKRNDIHDSKKYIGLIAQDVQAVLPEIVNEQNDLLSVEYTSIIPVIIESIKELYELIPK